MRAGKFTGLAGSVLAGIVLVVSVATAFASSANLSHSYSVSSPIADGSIVSADPHKSGYAVPANVDNGSKLIGVTVAKDDSLLAVDPQGNKVQVATSGAANTLVSNLNGEIKVGDQIAVSPFSGIGMKADPGSHIIGIAQSAFDTSTTGAEKRTVTDKSGKSQDVYVGYIKLSIAVGTNTADVTGVKLNSLQKLAKSLTGKTLSMVRIVIAMAVALIAIVSLITLIYASIYGSIISIGRNPLAKFAVFRTLSQVMGMALLITLVSGATIFLLLR